MAFTAEQIARATEDAREFLEYSVLTIAVTLGVLPEEISSQMAIPVGESDPQYLSYVSLIRQAAILEQMS